MTESHYRIQLRNLGTRANDEWHFVNALPAYTDLNTALSRLNQIDENFIYEYRLVRVTTVVVAELRNVQI